MSYLLVQVKNDTSKNLTASVIKSARKDLQPHDNLEKPEYPAYFGIYMSLRGEKKYGKGGKPKEAKDEARRLGEEGSGRGESGATITPPPSPV